MAKFADNLVSWERAAAFTLFGASAVALSSTVGVRHLGYVVGLLALSFVVGFRADLGRSGLLQRGQYPIPARAWAHLIGVFFTLLLVGVVLQPALLLGMLVVFPLFITAPGMQSAIIFLDACILAFGISDERWIGDARAAAFAVFLGATFSLHHHCERVRRNRAPYRASTAWLLLKGAFFGGMAAAVAFPVHLLIPSLSPVPPGPAEDMRPPTMEDLLLLLGYFAIVSFLFAVLLRILQRFKFVPGAAPELEQGSAAVVSQAEMGAEGAGPARPKAPRWTIVKLYHRMFEQLRPSGVLVLPSSTPSERTTTLARRAPERTAEIERLTELFHRARYGTDPVGTEEVRRMKTWTEAVRRAAAGAGAALALWAGSATAQDTATMNRLARAIAYKAHTYDVLSYDLEATIDPTTTSMHVRALVTVEMKEDAATLRFLIHRNARVERVGEGDVDWGVALSMFVPQLPANILDVTPPSPFAKGQRGAVEFAYEIPSRAKSPEPHAPTVQADWAWVDLASGWYPLMLYETFESRITLDIPESWDGVATGTLESSKAAAGRRRLVFGGAAQNTLLGFVCGKYRRCDREVGGRRLSTLTVAELPDKVRDLAFEQTGDLFTYYELMYGDPEVKDFTLVEMPPDNPSRPHNARTFAILTKHDWVCAGSETARSVWYGSLSHEVAHCWFGHLVPSDVLGRGGNWLREGLAEYSSYLALEKKFGPGSWIFRRALSTYLGDMAAFGDREPPLREMTYALDRDTSYEKGAWVFRMLRHEAGAEPFDRALARYVAEKRGGFATDSDFRALIEKESGQDMKPFFAAWEEGTGRLDLAVVGAPTRLADGRWTVRAEPRGTLRRAARVEVRWRTEAGKEGACEVEVPAEGGDLVLPCDGAPAAVEVDARNDYLDVDPWNNTWPARVRCGFSAIFALAPRPVAWVSSVADGSPAAEAGLREGDWITSTDGREIASPDDLPKALWDLREGGSLRLGVRRGEDHVEVVLE